MIFLGEVIDYASLITILDVFLIIIIIIVGIVDNDWKVINFFIKKNNSFNKLNKNKKGENKSLKSKIVAKLNLKEKFILSIRLLLLLSFFGSIFFGALYIASFTNNFLAKIILTVSVILFVQGSFAIVLLLYTWNNPLRHFHKNRYLPYEKPFYSFTALIPARHEESVIEQTIKLVDKIDYPEDKKQILVLIHEKDDAETIAIAQNVIDKINKKNVKLITFNGDIINKAHGLNIGLDKATKDIVTIFDAEDKVNADIFKVINTLFVREKVDIMQSGVQLMTYENNWYSLFNVLEYYFWFKSSLHLFSKTNAIPLGGNTVFFKRFLLEKVGGWDETSLTEDADIGIRLSTLNVKTTAFYNTKFVTKEQTPTTLINFLKQRTRWQQGFMQIFSKMDWLHLKSFKQQILILFVLLWPFGQAVLFILVPLFITTGFFIKLPLILSLISFLPSYILLILAIVTNLAIYEFTKEYNKKYSLWFIPKIFLLIIPYQMLLGISAFRAMYRQLIGQINWEKTEHLLINDKLITENEK